MRVVLTGGGTGGHLVPFEPIIEALRTKYLALRASLPDSLEPAEFRLYFVGIADAKTRDFFAHYDVTATHVPSGKLRRYASHLTIIDLLFRLPFGILKALWVIWRLMPDVIVSKGGYGSLPVIAAAVVYRIPILVHESDVVLGVANRLAIRFAAAVAVGSAAARAQLPQAQFKIFVTGTPVRNRFGTLNAAVAKKSFGFAPTEPVLLVMGGSLGAEQINEILLQTLPTLILETGIIHITGENHYTKIVAIASELLAASSRKDYYQPHPYLQDTVIEAMTAADVVVSRAGATTLAELTRLRKPMLLIPLASAANQHQTRNAQLYEAAGAARVLDPTNLGRNLFERSVKELLANTALREEFSRRLATLDHPAAANDIAELTFALARGLVPTPPS